MRSILFVFVVILSACSIGEKYKYNEFISDDEIKETLNIEANSKDISSNWYEIFKDSDLNTLILYLEKTNINILQAISRLKQSRQQLNIYSKKMYPIIDINGKFEYQKSNNKDFSFNDTNNFQVGFDASWEIDIWGRGKNISDQYFEIMQQAKYNLSDVKLSMTSEMIKNYINLRLAQEKFRITNKNLKLQEETLQTIRDKYNAGIADELDLNQAMLNVEQTKSSIPLLRDDIEKSKNAISVLLGVLPNDIPVNLDKYTKNITAHTFKYSVKELYKTPLKNIRNRADIRAVEQSIKIQNAVVNQAIIDLYPTLDVGASLGFISNSARRLFYQNKQIYGYAPNVTLPIWHWGMLKNNIELQKSIKEEYVLNYNEALLTAIMEIKDNIVLIKETLEANNHLKNARNQTKNILDITRIKYQNGIIEFVELARAEQELLKAENSLVENNAKILQNLTSFYKSVGGGYSINN